MSPPSLTLHQKQAKLLEQQLEKIVLLIEDKVVLANLLPLSEPLKIGTIYHNT